MARFCIYCGTRVSEDARFCIKCGRQLPAPAASAPQRNDIPPAPPQRENTTAPKTPVYKVPVPPARQEPVIEVPAEVKQPRKREQAKAEHPSPAMFIPQIAGRSASAGELDLGDFSFAGFTAEPAAKVYSPISGIFTCITSYLGGIISIFRKPLALIGVAVLAVMWVVLGGMRDSDSTIIQTLSWLIFAEGGFDRSLPGMVGGVLGKGTVAAALFSLLSGGIVSLMKGIIALFAGHGERRSMVSLVIGIVIGLAAYVAFTGPWASVSTTMAGIAGAVLSLEALGSGRGKLYLLAQSLTSRKTDGVRSEARGRCDGLLTGLAIGFAAGAALSAAGSAFM